MLHFAHSFVDKAIRPLVLILPEMTGYVKTFKVKDGDEVKNNIIMSFCKDDKKLCFTFVKYKNIWTENEDLKEYWIACFTSLYW